MKRRLVAALVLVVFLMTASPSAAGIDPTEIINTIILKRINHVLSALLLWEQRLIDRANIDVYNRYRFYAFPPQIFDPVLAAIADVRGIRSELNSLACGWQFSPRTAVLQQMYLRPLRMCRPTFDFVWGTHTSGRDRDLQELHDYTAVMTANQLSQRTQSEETMTRAFPETFRKALVPGYSPGEANRAEAAMLAMAGQVALSNNQLKAQKLLVDELERDLDRKEERHVANFSLFAVKGLATLGHPGWGGER